MKRNSPIIQQDSASPKIGMILTGLWLMVLATRANPQAAPAGPCTAVGVDMVSA